MNLIEIKKKIAIINNTKDIENIENILSYGDLGKKIVEVLDLVYELKHSNKLDLANQQFIGFKYGKWQGDDINGLVKEMGLTQTEWEYLKNNYSISGELEESEIDEINKLICINH